MSTASSNSYFFTVIEAKTIVSVTLLPLMSNKELYRLNRYSYKGLRNCIGPIVTVPYVVNITVQMHTRMVFGQNSIQIFKMVYGNGEDFWFITHYNSPQTKCNGYIISNGLSRIVTST
jgi:hypothetical protein